MDHFTPNRVTLPLPRFHRGKFFFEGFEFEDDPGQRLIMWSLFLASAYHLAAHMAVSDYSIYKRWARNKTLEVCEEIIDFIEDVFVEKYTESNHAETWQNLAEIKKTIEDVGYFKTTSKFDPAKPLAWKVKENEMLKRVKTCLMTLAREDNFENDVLKVADFLYKNRHLVPKNLPAFYDHEYPTEQFSYKKVDFDFIVGDDFRETAYKLDELWSTSEQRRIRMLKQLSKHMKGLQFDSVTLAPEDYYEFGQIRERLNPMIRRIKQQIRAVVNVADSSKYDEAGYIDMQQVIQSMASQKNAYDVFERVEERRSEEAWVILIDKSASMRLRFDHIKEFAVCVAEAANELSGGPDSWAMFSFDNNFQILKGFGERYGREVQARLGGLQNNGLSLLPDALDLSYRALLSDPREKKFLFVITDGHPAGYERINEQFSKMAKKVDTSGIILVAVGVSKSTSRRFRNSVRGNDLKQLVAKFITAYRAAASDM